MGDRISMSISGDNLSGEILNRDPLALILRRQYEISPGIDKHVANFTSLKQVYKGIRVRVWLALTQPLTLMVRLR